MHKLELWYELCERISQEHDPERLRHLILELMRAFDESDHARARRVISAPNPSD